MRFPKLLLKGQTIGVCAPSAGVTPADFPRLDNAIANVRALGYNVVESPSLRKGIKCVSAPAATRAAEFMVMYGDPNIHAIIPPWGGEFLMDILPHVDFKALAALPPKWISGYSDISTLTFPMTLLCDVATIHGSNFMNMGSAAIDPSDAMLFETMGKTQITQQSAPFWGSFSGWTDISQPLYTLDKPGVWKALCGSSSLAFKGRIIGGCMDTLTKLVGTEYGYVNDFLDKYSGDGFIWTLESCQMDAADIYRSLWQMEQAGWFRHCAGMMYGRAAGYSDAKGFTLADALANVFGPLGIPVIYDADIGHTPPIMQLVNGAYATVEYAESSATITQIYMN